MKWPRWTIRRLMVAVFGLALLLGLAIPFWEVVEGREFHLHGFFKGSGGVFCTGDDPYVRSPVWTSYRLRLLGRPWKNQPICGAGEGEVGETCEFARPDFVRHKDYHRWLEPPPVTIEGRVYKLGDPIPKDFNFPTMPFRR